MFNGAGMKTRMRALLSDRQGNFAMMTAAALPLLMGVAGAGLELTRVMQVKSDLQNAADGGTLGAATEARIAEGAKSNNELAESVKNYLGAQEWATGMTAEQKKDFEKNLSTVVTKSDTSKGSVYNITTTFSYSMPLNPMLSLIGADAITLRVTSTSQSSYNKGAPISMYLVLDRSGSMSFVTDTVDKSKSSCQNYTDANWSSYPNLRASSPCYVNKSTSLKTAVSYLVDTLNKSDPTYKAGSLPESTLVRTAAVAYNDSSFSAQNMDWGTKKTNAYVQAIPQYPTGGTNANAALTTAYNALKSSNTTEALARKTYGDNFFERYIVLMTDGEMTGASSSWNSSIDAAVRSTCATAKADGIKIFTIAFMAPARGKSLLQACATSNDNFYEPDNMDEIVEAFGDIARKAAGNISRVTN